MFSGFKAIFTQQTLYRENLLLTSSWFPPNQNEADRSVVLFE